MQLAGKLARLPVKISRCPAMNLGAAPKFARRATIVCTVPSRAVASKCISFIFMSSGTLDKIYLTKCSQIGVPNLTAVISAPVLVELGRAKVELALGSTAKSQMVLGCAQVDAGGLLFIFLF